MEQRGWPIDGGSKARRTGWRTPPNEISWGFMKLLREGNKTKRVYDVNPYVEVYRFYDDLYGLYNQSCDGGADVWMWLVIGPRKAMLVDTAFGLGDMKGLVDEITGGMPLIVANTSAGAEHVRRGAGTRWPGRRERRGEPRAWPGPRACCHRPWAKWIGLVRSSHTRWLPVTPGREASTMPRAS